MSSSILYRFKQRNITNGWSYYFSMWEDTSIAISGAFGDIFIVLADNDSTAIVLSKYGVRWVYKNAIEALK